MLALKGRQQGCSTYAEGRLYHRVTHSFGARAFILIETQVGRSRQVAQELRSLNGVLSADVVTGSFDIIALIQTIDMTAMADLVTGQMQGIRGVLRTITCVAAG